MVSHDGETALSGTTNPIMDVYSKVATPTGAVLKEHQIKSMILATLVAAGGGNVGFEYFFGHNAEIDALRVRVVDLEKYIEAQKRDDEITAKVKELMREQRRTERAMKPDSIKTNP